MSSVDALRQAIREADPMLLCVMDGLKARFGATLRYVAIKQPAGWGYLGSLDWKQPENSDGAMQQMRW